jgi:hypothetical protein
MEGPYSFIRENFEQIIGADRSGRNSILGSGSHLLKHYFNFNKYWQIFRTNADHTPNIFLILNR